MMDRNILGKKKSIIKWTTFVTSLEENPARQDFIVDVLKNVLEDDTYAFVLCDRANNTRGVYQRCVDLGLDTDLKVGEKSAYNVDCKVLVGGIRKCGTGFNDPKRNMLFLCCDVTDPRQYEGRIRSSKEIVFDFVDDHFLSERHFSERCKAYKAKGAKIINYKGILSHFKSLLR